jgi:epsin
MPTIYQRFTEKEANQWRQIYKALVLLEFLVKNGSERVIDDARSHLSLIKVLRNFYYTDEQGKDQGINVRNRSKELAELLADLDKVRAERRKAKANRNKYTGTGNDGGDGNGPSFMSNTGSRYGGFGSDSLSGRSCSLLHITTRCLRVYTACLCATPGGARGPIRNTRTHVSMNDWGLMPHFDCY